MKQYYFHCKFCGRLNVSDMIPEGCKHCGAPIVDINDIKCEKEPETAAPRMEVYYERFQVPAFNDMVAMTTCGKFIPMNN